MESNKVYELSLEEVKKIREDKEAKKERKRSLEWQTCRHSPTIDQLQHHRKVKSFERQTDKYLQKEGLPHSWSLGDVNDMIEDKTPFAKYHLILISEDETEYTKMFQKFFINGISLKKDIVKKIKRIKGVESVGVGFSTERDGYWPVIRVIADEETCEEMKQDKQRRTTLVEEVIVALKDALIQLHPSTSWNEDELENTIEIVMKYPLQAYELCSAGEVVETTYNFHDNVSNKTDRRHGVMGYSVCHEITIGDDEPYTSYYEITAYHPLIPSHSEHFRQTLDPLPTTDTTLDTSVKYNYIGQGDDTDDVALATSPPQDPLLLDTLLRATIFPQKSYGKDGFQRLKQSFSYTCKILKEQAPNPGDQATADSTKAELVVGKSGLVKMTNNENKECSYEYNIVNKQGKEVQEVHNEPYHKHPCNIDIAALKYTDDSRQHVCSIEESFADLTAGEGVSLPQPPQKITWSGPPGQSLEERKGKVVYIEKGAVHLLSDKLIKFNDPPQPGEYPGYVWEPADNIPLNAFGHSGAPVFLISRNGTTFHLLGNLITKRSASPVKFSLNMVHADIAIDHIDQLLTAEQPYLPSGIGLEMIEPLKTYKQYLTLYNEHQSLTPLMEERKIRCELKICIDPHQNNQNNN